MTPHCGTLAAPVLALMLVAGTARGADDVIVARLKGQDIKLSTIQPLLAGLDAPAREEAGKNPQALTALVRAELGQIALVGEAKQKNWPDRPEIQRKIKQATDVVIATTYLAAMAPVPGNFPSDAEIADAYDKNRQQFMLPRQYHLAQIFVPAGADAEQRAKDLAAEAKAKPADFDSIATRSAAAGDTTHVGDLGWTPEDRIVPEVRSAVQGMAENEIGDPIRTSSGWHIMQLLGTRPTAVRPLAEVRDTIVGLLRQKRQQEEERRYLDQLLVKQGAAVNEIALKQALEQPQ